MEKIKIVLKLSLYLLILDHSDKMEFGYKQFMGEIYGENILFADGEIFDKHFLNKWSYC